MKKMKKDKGLLGEVQFSVHCRRHGLASTHQRWAVYKELAGTLKHPDAATIYKGVKKRLPSISLDTVYRTLRTFESKGMVVAVTTIHERTRYDADVSDHAHFVCTQCGAVTDIDEIEETDINLLKNRGNFGKVSSVRVELHGICKECSRRSQ